MATIAFCGIGIMGSEMATRLKSAGHTVRVWNRAGEKAQTWAREHDGVACATPADAADPASELHIMVSNDDAVDRILFGSDGALTTLPKGSLVVDHSTVSVLLVDSRAERIKSGGWRYLHAPVLAGPSTVATGDGLMLVAGANSVYAQAKPTLSQIIVKHWYIGETERLSAAYKLMANSMLISITQALAEFYSLGRACGIDPEQALALFEHFNPGGTIAIRGPRMARGDFAPAFQVTMAAKDADLILKAGRQGGADMPAIELALHRFLRLIKSGHGDLDMGALALPEVHASSPLPNAAGEFAKAGGDG